MATFTELRALFGNGEMINKVQVATILAANDVLDEATPVSARRAWAESAMSGNEAAVMWRFVLAANASATSAQILAATDAAILAALNDAIDKRFGPAI